YIGNKNTRSVEMNNIKVDKKDSLSNAGTSISVLHISDMHLENISVTPEQLYENLKGQHIDLIALTGDFMDRKRSIPRLFPYLQVCSQLKPVHGAYAVFGNHDYVLKNAYFNQLKEMLNEYGVKTLQNENERIIVDGKTLNVIGIDDFGTNRSNLSKSYEGLEKGGSLVLTHDPNIGAKITEFYFDYLLSGNFHGRQIHWPKPYHSVKMGGLVRMNMVKGIHPYNGRPFYISEGLGQTGVNI